MIEEGVVQVGTLRDQTGAHGASQPYEKERQKIRKFSWYRLLFYLRKNDRSKKVYNCCSSSYRLLFSIHFIATIYELVVTNEHVDFLCFDRAFYNFPSVASSSVPGACNAFFPISHDLLFPPEIPSFLSTTAAQLYMRVK